MKRARKSRCLIDKDKAPEMNSSTTGYFGVGRVANNSKVDMRVDYRNRNIGKFFHRIQEDRTLVMAVFLVEIITHYGGRKPQKGGRKYKEMNLRALAHEIFNRLPNIPKEMDEYLTAYTPVKDYLTVPPDYKRFIIEKWTMHKEEVLRLAHTCVVQGTLHLQLLTEDARTTPSIASHGEPEQSISKMVIEEEQTPDQLETKHEMEDRLVEIMLEIDDCLRHAFPITREEANKTPTALQCEEVSDVEREKCSYSDNPLDLENLSNLLPGDYLPLHLSAELSESDFLCCGEGQNIKSGVLLIQKQIGANINYNTTSDDQDGQRYPIYTIPMISISDLQEILEHPND